MLCSSTRFQSVPKVRPRIRSSMKSTGTPAVRSSLHVGWNASCSLVTPSCRQRKRGVFSAAAQSSAFASGLTSPADAWRPSSLGKSRATGARWFGAGNRSFSMTNFAMASAVQSRTGSQISPFKLNRTWGRVQRHRKDVRIVSLVYCPQNGLAQFKAEATASPNILCSRALGSASPGCEMHLRNRVQHPRPRTPPRISCRSSSGF